ncbi:MAG: hypothetical protein M9894_10620 [Planctomycetes bacterium]|nr:hypothetical protein [Planctomycetota bacterium]
MERPWQRPFTPFAARALGEDAWPWLAGGGAAHLAFGLLGLVIVALTTPPRPLAAAGILLFAGGALQVAQAFRLETRGGLFGYLGAGVIAVVGGLALVWPPTVVAPTLLLGSFLVALGAFRVAAAAMQPLPGGRWPLAGGVATFVLGLLAAVDWTATGWPAIGLVVSADLLATGAAQVLVALDVRRLTRGQAGPAPA